MPRQPPVDLKPWFIALEDLAAPIDFAEFFGNDLPVEVDVGSGRGMFLVNAGAAHPATNFLGIELDFKEGRRAARRLKKRQMPNVRVIGGDVHVLLARYLQPASVSAVHVYFPDPWWKQRHKKRRVFTDQFVSQVATVLAPGGLVHVWTDVEEYFCVMSALMDHDQRFERLPPPAEHVPQHDLDFQTSFERRKRQAGETIYRGCWQRRG
jgi:tRNA (guanine-N7-)-methyltransferase